ncbi:MAG: preprotein translocase subunit SecY, partial [Candidatus Hydrothermarchaeota archaeon]
AIPNFILKLVTGGNPSEALIRHGLLPDMVGLAATIVVFLVVVYAESMRIELPLSYGRVRGAKGRYPIRFVYVSNIPVILAVALFQNVRLWSLLLHKVDFPWSHLLGNWQQTEHGLDLVGGLAYYLSSPPKVYLPGVLAEQWLHILIYIVSMLIACVIFGILWVDITGMGPKQVAKQLQQAGMQIPGFRRDIRVMERVLSRYIPVITIISSLFVGALAAFADIWGALGTGTGILLTAGIVYRLYEEIAREQFTEMFPAVRKFIGAEY